MRKAKVYGIMLNAIFVLQLREKVRDVVIEYLNFKSL